MLVILKETKRQPRRLIFTYTCTTNPETENTCYSWCAYTHTCNLMFIVYSMQCFLCNNTVYILVPLKSYS